MVYGTEECNQEVPYVSQREILRIDQLSRAERLVLVQEIWDIAADPSPPLLSEAHRQELERRVIEDDATPDDAVPWEQAKAEILRRLGASAERDSCPPPN